MKIYDCIKYCICLFIILVQLSCKEEKTKITHRIPVGDIDAIIHFPDTIVAGQTYRDGFVKYKHLVFNKYEEKYKEKTSRLLTFCLTIDTVKYEQYLPDDKVKDTIWSAENDNIKFFPLHIKKPSIYYLSGNIIDEIFFDTISSNVKTKLPGYKISSFVSKKIVVIDK